MAMKGNKTRLPSKTHSCSELEIANKNLIKVKKEAEMEKELQKQIKDMGFPKLGLHTKEHQVWVSGALVFLVS